MEQKTVEYLNTKIWFRALKVVVVTFFLILFISINAIPFFSFSSYRALDLEQSRVSCNNGTQFSLKDTGWTFKDNEFENTSGSDFAYTSVFVDKCNGEVTIYDLFDNDAPTYSVGMAEIQVKLLEQIKKSSIVAGQFDAQLFMSKAQSSGVSNDDIFRVLSAAGYVKDGKITETYNPPQPLTPEEIQKARESFANMPPTQTPPRNFVLSVKYSYPGFIELCLWLFLVANATLLCSFLLLRGVFYYIVLGSFRPKR